MQIYIKNDNLDHPLTLEVKPTDTISTLKDMMRHQICFSDEQGLLVLDGRNLLDVDGSSTLEKCGLKDEASLQLGVKQPFLVRVKAHAHGDHDIEVDCFDTVLDLKEKIRKRTRVPVAKQLLDHKCNFLCDDESSLLSLGIFKSSSRLKPQHIIYLNPTSSDYKSFGRVPRIPLVTSRALSEATAAGLSAEEFLQSDRYRSLPPLIYPDDDSAGRRIKIVVHIPSMGWNFLLTVNPTDTIGTVRDEIVQDSFGYDELFGQCYIHDRLFLLVFNRKLLEDDSLTLDECSIKNMDRIELFDKASFPIDIHMYTCKGEQCISIVVESLDTIGLLKAKIQDITGIPREHQKIMKFNFPLQDEERLVDHDIVKPVVYDRSTVRESDKNRRFWNFSKTNFSICLFVDSNEENQGGPVQPRFPLVNQNQGSPLRLMCPPMTLN